ncbi:hypothetical protein BC938DRAFT_475774 [Jimgerdemannia flammicorona]|uniref:HCP-like protein n=1 Tax=Jimgerdemannia flammicorona TaxID=994334 RepID=A0A433QR92_9FUNG|nr:hypothetical protein BC938DRAFT_475774 [Jimgerdemannia flammicorona]
MRFTRRNFALLVLGTHFFANSHVINVTTLPLTAVETELLFSDIVLLACVLTAAQVEEPVGELHRTTDKVVEEQISESSETPSSEDSSTTSQESDLSKHERGTQLYESALLLLSALQPPTTAPSSRPRRRHSSSDEPGILTLTLQLITHSILSLFHDVPVTDNTKDEAPLGRAVSDSNTMDSRLVQAVEMLEKAGYDYENNDALFILGEMNFHSRYTHPRNYTAALSYYTHLAARTGNATAQQNLGFLYATGLGGAVPQRDQGKALLYHTFAALGRDTAAEMTLGYRYLTGIGTPQKCEDALYYYKKVADKGGNVFGTS